MSRSGPAFRIGARGAICALTAAAFLSLSSLGINPVTDVMRPFPPDGITASVGGGPFGTYVFLDYADREEGIFVTEKIPCANAPDVVSAFRAYADRTLRFPPGNGVNFLLPPQAQYDANALYLKALCK
jgi:hypothetical protein